MVTTDLTEYPTFTPFDRSTPAMTFPLSVRILLKYLGDGEEISGAILDSPLHVYMNKAGITDPSMQSIRKDKYPFRVWWWHQRFPVNRRQNLQ